MSQRTKQSRRQNQVGGRLLCAGRESTSTTRPCRVRSPWTTVVYFIVMALLASSLLVAADTVSATVSRAPGQPDETRILPIYFVASFSEVVTNFTFNDVQFSGAGTIAGGVSPTGDASTYTIEVSSASADGMLAVSIPAGVCWVQSGSTTVYNAASGEASVLLDREAPDAPALVSPATDDKTQDTTPSFTWTAADDHAGSGVKDYTLFVMGAAGFNHTTPSLTHTPGSDLPEGQYQWCVQVRDNVGNSNASTSRFLTIDTSPPVNPNVSSASHNVGAWSNDASVDIDINGASDRYTAVAGYEVAWNQSSTWSSSGSPNRSSSWSGETFPATSDGNWYFHICTVDEAGNWSMEDSYGPFKIDATAPTDPGIVSTSHVPGVWSDNPNIAISADEEASDPDPGSGVDGFEVEWNQSATWTPTETKNRGASWTGATYTATSDGHWYFHIATVDNAGNWTSTRHLGPFQIDTTPPELTVPAKIETLSDPGLPTAVVTYSPTATDNLDPAPVVVSDPPSGTAFPIGTTVVTVTGTDHAGNEATGTFEVCVQDREAPVLIGVPDGLHGVTEPGKTTVPVFWDPITADDNDDPSPVVIVSHPSGSAFPAGVTHVRVTARDRNGKEATATFDVTVKYTPPLFDFTVVPAGEFGFLDRGLPEEDGIILIGNLELAAIYEIGEVIAGACSLVRPSGEVQAGSYIIIGFYQVDVSLDPEKGLLLATWNASFDHETLCFHFDFDTTDLVPGIYDFRLGFEDGSVIWIRVKLVEPPEEVPLN